MQILAVAILGLVMFGLAVATPFIRVALLPLFKFNTQVNTNEKIIEKTYDADNVIYNYEWFKSTYEQIQADKTKIKTAQTAVDNFEFSAGDRSKWTFEDKNEDARLRSVVTGIQSHYEDLVAQYNARAKMANRNIFQENLPLFIQL